MRAVRGADRNRRSYRHVGRARTSGRILVPQDVRSMRCPGLANLLGCVLDQGGPRCLLAGIERHRVLARDLGGGQDAALYRLPPPRTGAMWYFLALLVVYFGFTRVFPNRA